MSAYSPGTPLTVRLANVTFDPDEHPFANAHLVEILRETVVEWLRQRDNERGDNVMAALADQVERGEA